MLTKAEISDFRELGRSSALRDECSLVLVEGFRSIDGARRAGAKIRTIFTTDASNINFDAYRHSSEIKEVDAKAIEKISTTPSPQDAIAICDMPAISLELFRTKSRTRPIFVLDNVSDPGNLGTIFRSALAFNIGGVITLGGCDAFHPKVVRSSAGTLFGVPIYQAQEFELEELLCDRTLYIADMKADKKVEDIRSDQNVAIVFGNEANGVKTKFFLNNAEKFTIEIVELCESLNVAMAATIVAHEMRK